MKLVLAALNAQYIHTNLAVRSIAASLRRCCPGVAVEIGEYTINQETDYILEDLVRRRGDVYIFSCYIWNVDEVCTVAHSLAKVSGALLFAGGPQAAADGKSFLGRAPFFDAVLRGEGESVVPLLAEAILAGQRWQSSRGLLLRDAQEDGTVQWVENDEPPPMDLDALPFAYDDLPALAGRILYYESMRGCPYRCSYCMSGAETKVRCKSLGRVKDELRIFLDAGVRQVKFVDRTFNCKPRRALDIWKFLAENDNGTTGFHFELAGTLLDEESMAFLATVREGLFQFEIGIQSTHGETLQEIGRRMETEDLFPRVERLRQAGNVHLHLDLIAGLPHEDAARFARSFDDVYSLRPHQMQLGFLKVLPGSEMQAKAENYGLVWRSKAPFEVLYNRWVSYEELAGLKLVAEMVESYHNSGRFNHLVEYLCGFWESAFAFYSQLARFYEEKGCRRAPPGKLGMYELLGDFAREKGLGPDERMEWLCRFDMALHEKPRKIPNWVQVDGSRPNRERVLDFYRTSGNLQRFLPAYAEYEPKQVLKMAHVEVFPFDPGKPLGDGGGECAILFDYTRRDLTGKAQSTRIAL